MTIEQNSFDHGAEARRPTVCVTCAVPTGLQIALHRIHDEPGVDHNKNITLQAGDNPGIDRGWFGCWLQENSELSVVTGGQLTWRDEKPSEPQPEEVRTPIFAQPQSQPGSIEEMRQPGDAPLLQEPDRDRENPSVPREDDKTAH